VLIPAYEARETLASTLQSVRKQSLAPLEVIVVDDCSTDGTSDLAREVGATPLVNEVNLGPAVSRNIAARSARGEILVFLDADVVVPPGILMDFATALHEMPDVAAVQTLYTPTCPGENAVTTYQNFYYYYSLARLKMTHVAVLATWCVAIRKRVFHELGGFNENIPEPTVEDEELGYALTDAGYSILLAKGLQVTHLARYTLGQFLKRRARMARAQAKSGWRSIRNRLLLRYMNLKETGTHHSRWMILSILLVLLAAASGAASVATALAGGRPGFVLWLFPASLVGSLLCHLPLLRCASRQLAERFRLLPFLALLLADAAALGYGIARGTVEFILGQRY
jgi:glycosyltransferase involved in cell wall biosynthesis